MSAADVRVDLAARVTATWATAGQLVEALVGAMAPPERQQLEAALEAGERVGVTIAWAGGDAPRVELRVGLVGADGESGRVLLAVDRPLGGGDLARH